MHPISTIVRALFAGAAAASKETASDTVRNAYNELKAAVVLNWAIGVEDDKADKEEVKLLLEKLESDPEMSQIRVEKKLAEAMPAPAEELVAKAQQLYDQLAEPGFNQGGHGYASGELDNVAAEWYQMGKAWADKGNYVKAIEYYEQALKVTILAFGDEHPNVAEALNQLGRVWADKGDIGIASGYFENALTMSRNLLGPKHPQTIQIANNLEMIKGPTASQ